MLVYLSFLSNTECSTSIQYTVIHWCLFHIWSSCNSPVFVLYLNMSLFNIFMMFKHQQTIVTLIQMPVPSQEYDSCCPFGGCVLLFNFAIWLGTFRIEFSSEFSMFVILLFIITLIWEGFWTVKYLWKEIFVPF